MKILLFSHSLHTFFTHLSHSFHTHISHACEILHSEIYVKRVWSDVIPFIHIFTYTSHGVSHRLSHVNPHWMAKEFHMLLKFTHIFTYTSHGVSHELSHIKSSVIMNGNRISHATSHKFRMLLHMHLFMISKSTSSIHTQIYTCTFHLE